MKLVLEFDLEVVSDPEYIAECLRAHAKDITNLDDGEGNLVTDLRQRCYDNNLFAGRVLLTNKLTEVTSTFAQYDVLDEPFVAREMAAPPRAQGEGIGAPLRNLNDEAASELT